LTAEQKILIALGLWTLTVLPVCPDPFHPPQEKPVPFWIWLYRELYELQHGEVGLPFSVYE